MGNQDPIIGHRNVLIPGAAVTAPHLPLIEHTAAAVDNQLILSEIFRKFLARSKLEYRFFSGIPADPGRQLDRSDISALAVMGAALAD